LQRLVGKKMKRPSFQFYPSDWLRDTALRSCTTGARGLWIDMICFMHEGNPYGHLKVGDKVIHAENLARMVGESLETLQAWLTELSEASVFETTPDGVIYSKRMVRDENLRQIRAAGGIKGGNPALLANKVNLKDNHMVNDEVIQKTTPSSSSSSSSSTSLNTFISPPDGEPEQKADKKLPGCDHKSIVELYHQLLPTMRRVEVWNDTRAGYLRQRWREVAVELSETKEITHADVLTWWEEFFKHVSKSKFLTGKINDKSGRTFVADLEWIIKPSNFAKIVEGKYHVA